MIGKCMREACTFFSHSPSDNNRIEKNNLFVHLNYLWKSYDFFQTTNEIKCLKCLGDKYNFQSNVPLPSRVYYTCIDTLDNFSFKAKV